MKKKAWKKHGAGPLWTAGVFVLVVALVLIGLRNMSGSVDSSGLKNAEDAVRRADQAGQ